MKLRCAILPVLLLVFIAESPRAAADDLRSNARFATLGSADLDSDHDSLPDFQETHKYFTDPHKKSTAGKNVADGDWEERRQFTYSIRSIIRVLRPYNLRAMNDDYQDVRVRQETKDYVELEVISYPLNTNNQVVTDYPVQEVHAARG